MDILNGEHNMRISTEKKDSIKLSNGVLVPRIFLGTYNIIGEDAKSVLEAGYKVGYKAIDCGRYYGNEKNWGDAIKSIGIERSSIFIQTKIDYTLERKKIDIIEDFQKTLDNFNTNYIDSLLIHWPVYDTFLGTWRSLEKLYREGRVRSIGVSNFRVEHFEILRHKAEIWPMIAQFERHPCRKQYELVDYCIQNNIQPEAYQPLAVGRPELLENETLKIIADNHKCSIAQVALAWNIQTGVIPLPRSKNLKRLKENFDSLFILLSEDEIKVIDNDKNHYFRALKESSEYPGYWDQIHRVEISKFVW
jgi:diketogulonate reductase-like aldo/keto reductase